MDFLIKDGWMLNPNEKAVKGLLRMTERNDGHCPCAGNKYHGTDDDICPCKAYREEDVCCCKLYLKANEE